MAQLGRPGLSVAQKRELWQRWKAGQSLSEIGRALGSLRAAAEVCGTTHKTVRRVLERQRLGPPPPRAPRRRNVDLVRDVVREKVAATDGRISAKRLLPLARAAGYAGSARNLRRLVRHIKDEWRRRRRVYAPGCRSRASTSSTGVRSARCAS